MKQVLKNIPFEELSNDIASLNVYDMPLNDADQKKYDTALDKYNQVTNLDNFYNRHNLKAKEDWLLPQLTARFASFTLTRNAENGKINGRKFWTENVDMNSKWENGIYQLVHIHNRGLLVDKQNKPEGVRYSALVPLVLAAHKDFNGVAYNDWDAEQLHNVVDKHLLAAMESEPLEYTDEVLLAMREETLPYKNNPAKRRNITGMSTISKVTNNAFNELPKFAKVMLLQAWVANQSLRTKYMILNPLDWDNMPPPLVGVEVLPFVQQPKHKYTATDMWGV